MFNTTFDYRDSSSNRAFNYFNVEDEFFLIDSDSLMNSQTKLYGFSVQPTGIYENDNLTNKAAEGLDGCGSYVYVKVDKDKNEICIKQDFNGSWGIYLYQDENYFALSNSFFRLLDHIKTRSQISINRDYANYILTAGVGSQSYSETPINEIILVRKDADIYIDIKNKYLEIVPIDYREESISLSSWEGIVTLDIWYKKWTTIFRNLKNNTDQIELDLSGGIDSRLTFLLFVCSKSNLNDVYINSNNNNLHTHTDDYMIASQIASYYGVQLNNNKLNNIGLNYSMNDIITSEFHTNMLFHNRQFYRCTKYMYKRYKIPGAGGGSIRALWPMTPSEFIQQEQKAATHYPFMLSREISNSISQVLEKTYLAIDDKYHLNDKNSLKYPALVNLEARCRNHFGKAAVERYFANIFQLSPLLDPTLLQIKHSIPDCRDEDLLVALIFQRYCPVLLEFPFEGGRSINHETIQSAIILNNNVPYKNIDMENNGKFNINTVDSNVETILKTNPSNQLIKINDLDRYLENVFYSPGLRKIFSTYFDDSIIQYAAEYSQTHNYFGMRYEYPVIGITRVIEDILVSLSKQNSTIMHQCERYIQSYSYDSNESNLYLSEIIDRHRDAIACRIDIKLSGTTSEFEITSISDNRAKVTMPVWFQQDGKGYVIEAYRGSIDIVFHIKDDGQLTLRFRSRDVRDSFGNRIPFWIEYQNIKYNNQAICQEPIKACHDTPYTIIRQVKFDDCITLHIEWTENK